jgi:endonuclease/exonuclease/phosphatase family metal-dependent hydrolase
MRHIRLRTGAIAAAAFIAVAAGLAGLAALALSDSEQGKQTYLQFNLCGNACNSGSLLVVTDLVRWVQDRQPFALTLNEVCENQYDRLRSDLGRYSGRFEATGPTCRNGARFGNAILVRTTDVSLVGSWELPNPAGDEPRRLMCLRTQPSAAPSLVVCVTHISNEAANIEAQVSAVADLLSTLDMNNAVLLGGDFNTVPGDARMDPLYRTCEGGGGLFHEADTGGCANRSVVNGKVGPDVINEGTYGPHKYDYIFLSDEHWSSSTADVTAPATGLSDHEALWATTTFAR